MKNKIFSKGLYLEGLRQLKLVGIISAVIVSVLAAIIPVGSGINRMNQIQYYSGTTVYKATEEIEISKEIISGLSINPFLFLIFLVIAPLMALILFGFLNKRRTSDFYHSIPHTRLSIFFSFITAIMTWVTTIILSSTLAATIAYLVFSKYFVLLYGDLLIFTLASLVISFMAVCATAIAASITGTPFSNFLFAGMILLLPRVLIAAFNGFMIAQTLILYTSFSLFGNGYNLYTTAFIAIFEDFEALFDGTVAEYYLSATGIIYTLVLGLIYLALGAWLFVKRKSESAERSAPSRRLQTVYRTLVTSAFCMIPCIAIFIIGTDGYGFDSGDIFGLVVLYVLALILYFVYELITTRKWKNLLRAIPGLGIVLLCNLAVIGGLFGMREYHLSFTPDADEITGVSVVYDNESYFYYTLSFRDYVETQFNEIVLDSPDIKEIVSKGLSGVVNAIRQGGANAYYYYGDDYDTKPGDRLYESVFRISTKWGSRVRRIKISQEDQAKIDQLLKENEQYYKMWTELPEPATYDFQYRPEEGYIDKTMPTSVQKELFKLMKEEVAAMDFDIWRDFVNNSGYGPDLIGEVLYPVRINKTSVPYLRLPISYQLMPKTSALLLEYYSSDNEDTRESALTMLKDIAEHGDDWAQASMTVYIPQGDGTLVSCVKYFDYYNNYNWEYDYSDKEYVPDYSDFAAAVEYVTSKVKDGPIGSSDAFALIDVTEYTMRSESGSGYSYTYYEPEEYCVLVPLSDVSIAKLEELGFGYTSSGFIPDESRPIEDEGVFTED